MDRDGGSDNVLVFLIRVTRHYLCFVRRSRGDLGMLSKFDICNTLPRLEHDKYFCTLWNEIVQEAGNRGSRILDQ